MIKFIYLKNSFDRLCQVVIERNCRGEKKSLASPISFVLASSAKLRSKEEGGSSRYDFPDISMERFQLEWIIGKRFRQT